MKPLTVQALPLCIVCKADQLFFFSFSLTLQVCQHRLLKVHLPPAQWAVDVLALHSLAHAFTRKVLTERLQVPWLPPRPCAGDFLPSSGSLPALCPKRCASQQGLAASAALSVRVPGTGGDPHHSLLLRRQAVPATPAKCGESAGKGIRSSNKS